MSTAEGSSASVQSLNIDTLGSVSFRPARYWHAESNDPNISCRYFPSNPRYPHNVAMLFYGDVWIFSTSSDPRYRNRYGEVASNAIEIPKSRVCLTHTHACIDTRAFRLPERLDDSTLNVRSSFPSRLLQDTILHLLKIGSAKIDFSDGRWPIGEQVSDIHPTLAERLDRGDFIRVG